MYQEEIQVGAWLSLWKGSPSLSHSHPCEGNRSSPQMVLGSDAQGHTLRGIWRDGPTLILCPCLPNCLSFPFC
jgi:hypothetical protein